MAKDEANTPTSILASSKGTAKVLDQTLQEMGQPANDKPVDPIAQRQIDCWNEFEAADFEQQMPIFTGVLNEPWMTRDLVLDMAFPLFDASFEHDQRDRFDQLIDLVRQKRPEYFAADAVAYLRMLITNALATGNTESLPCLVHEMAEVGERDIDDFNHVLDLLAYHGHLKLLLDARRTAWPQVQNSRKIVAWGVDEFARKGVYTELGVWLAEHPEADASDLDNPQLRDRILFFGSIDLQIIGDTIERMSGRRTNPWTLEDFRLDRPRPEWRRKRKDDENGPDPAATEHLSQLSCEFLGYAHREAGVPWPQAQLVMPHLIHYILDRHNGQLEGSMLSRMMGSLSGAQTAKSRSVANNLCPDRPTFERYLSQLLSPLGAKPPLAAALFLLMPSWLRFLESRGLLDAKARTNALTALAGFSDELARVLAEWGEVPALAEDVRRWREQAL